MRLKLFQEHNNSGFYDIEFPEWRDLSKYIHQIPKHEVRKIKDIIEKYLVNPLYGESLCWTTPYGSSYCDSIYVNQFLASTFGDWTMRINLSDDSWFIVESRDKAQPFTRSFYFKCDQLDGLIEFLNYKSKNV